MAQSNNIQVLIADSDDAGRAAAAGILEAQGYEVIQAVDGGSAMKVAGERNIDIAIIGQHMYPKTGFDFAKHVLVKGLDIGMIMVTDDPSTDLLVEAGKYEIKQVLRKPVDPLRLSEVVRRVLRAQGKNPAALGSGGALKFTPADLMRRAIALAQQNARSRMGGPFGAVVADAEGRILGEGVNAVTSRCDPTAHAEVAAIRRATEARNSVSLEGCAVYCSSEPTMLGQALIISTGIKKVYYGLSHAEVGATRINESGIVGEIAKPLSQRAVPYEQLQHGEALAMFQAWQGQAKKVAD